MITFIGINPLPFTITDIPVMVETPIKHTLATRLTTYVGKEIEISGPLFILGLTDPSTLSCQTKSGTPFSINFHPDIIKDARESTPENIILTVIPPAAPPA